MTAVMRSTRLRKNINPGVLPTYMMDLSEKIEIAQTKFAATGKGMQLAHGEHDQLFLVAYLLSVHVM